MDKGSGTRSGLLWEVERLLSECENKPQVLLMENVTQVHCVANDKNFKAWQLRLEELGYQSYWHDMSAVDYGIPQTRNRTFMISILGNYNYNFPKKIKLDLRLKDFEIPESQVAEKYYLSEKMINYIKSDNEKWSGNNDKSLVNKSIASTINTAEGSRRCDASNYVSDFLPEDYDLKNPNSLLIKNATQKGFLEAEEGDGIDISSRMESHRGTVQKGKAQTLTTMGGENVGVVVKDTQPKLVGGIGEKKSNGGTRWYQQDRIYDDKVAICVTTSFNPYYAIKENEKPNYTEKSLEKIKKNIVEEDGVAGSVTATGMQSINHDGCQLIKVNLKRGYACEIKQEQEDTTDVDVIGNYSKSNFNQTAIVGKNGVAPTVTENHGQVTAIVEKEETLQAKLCNKLVEDGLVKEGDVVKHSYTRQILESNKKCVEKNDGNMITLTTRCDSVGTAVKDNFGNLRIRKLTPKECFRLMGLKDEDIENISIYQSDASNWHLAGDSIVTTCLMAIFGQLLDIDWKDKFKPELWWKNE